MADKTKEYEELTKLHLMVCTAREFMEEPSLETRQKWDEETSAYVEELEQVLVSLHAQAGEVVFALFAAKGGRS